MTMTNNNKIKAATFWEKRNETKQMKNVLKKKNKKKLNKFNKRDKNI